MRILVVNAGSSSLKLRVLDAADAVVATADLPAPRGSTDAGLIAEAVAGFGEIAAVGHRIVHGGTRYSGPVLLDEEERVRLVRREDVGRLVRERVVRLVLLVDEKLALRDDLRLPRPTARQIHRRSSGR